MQTMKMFRAFVADDSANVSTKAIIGTLVAIVLVTSLVGLVADNVAAGQASSNLTATQKTLLGLLTLAFILVPVIAIFRDVGGRDNY